jgi:hypothetical protein
LFASRDVSSRYRFKPLSFQAAACRSALSAGDFSDPARPVALGASGWIDSAAGLRRLLDRRKAGAAAGGALAFDRVRFRLFHVRSQNDKFLLPSLQTEAGDLKDFSNLFQAGIYL